ncbi:hypothetical protein [Insulibacter thermoxylanivorax]|nr:hypothetical protein [Insulibacter thermoxylanivorax]
MARFLTRLGILALLVCCGIFYGVDLATNGIEDIYGKPGMPAEDGVPASSYEGTAVQADPVWSADQEERDPWQALEQPVQDTALVNVIADATGTVLQRTARGGIELIVSLFDGILH